MAPERDLQEARLYPDRVHPLAFLGQMTLFREKWLEGRSIGEESARGVRCALLPLGVLHSGLGDSARIHTHTCSVGPPRPSRRCCCRTSRNEQATCTCNSRLRRRPTGSARAHRPRLGRGSRARRARHICTSRRGRTRTAATLFSQVFASRPRRASRARRSDALVTIRSLANGADRSLRNPE